MLAIYKPDAAPDVTGDPIAGLPGMIWRVDGWTVSALVEAEADPTVALAWEPPDGCGYASYAIDDEGVKSHVPAGGSQRENADAEVEWLPDWPEGE